MEHVRQTLVILQHHKLYPKLSKCEFGQTELEYPGHVISDQGVKVNLKKVEAMLAWPKPITITDLRGFLSLTGYYWKFVQGYGVITLPLTNLLKKGKFV